MLDKIFEDTYPPEVAMWCNANNAYIKEIEPVNGKRCFQIKPIPLKTEEELAKMVRIQRDGLIAETDYLVLPDYPLDEKKLVEVKIYRQALRDIPKQSGFPQTVEWPVKPEWL